MNGIGFQIVTCKCGNEFAPDVIDSTYCPQCGANHVKTVASVVVDIMKVQIRQLIAAGRVPATIRNFVELDDYIDSNELGGLCDDETVAGIMCECGFGEPDEDSHFNNDFLCFVDHCQTAVGVWIAGGMN